MDGVVRAGDEGVMWDALDIYLGVSDDAKTEGV